MNNTDAIILVVALVFFAFGWISAKLNRRRAIAEMRALVQVTKQRANAIYQDGWQDGWDSLAQNPVAMKKEMDLFNRTTPPKK